VSSSNLVAGSRGAAVPEANTSIDSATDLSWLYARYHRQVFHLALRYGQGDVAWAEDLTQDIFLALMRLPRPLLARESLSGWFYRVATNRCLNAIRKEKFLLSKPVRWLLGSSFSNERTPESLAIARDDLSQALQSVDALPPKERVVFFMVHVDGKEQGEAARVLGYSKGYVSKLLKRAEQRLAAAGWKVERRGD
jgi:RNA polymerase sigma-70 factor (ECF subfamily)